MLITILISGFGYSYSQWLTFIPHQVNSFIIIHLFQENLPGGSILFYLFIIFISVFIPAKLATTMSSTDTEGERQMLSSPTCLSESFKDFSFDTASPATTALPKPISHPIKNWRACSFGTKRKRSLPQGTLRQSRSGRFAKLVSNTSDSNASMSRSLLCTVKVRDDETVNSCDVRDFDGKDNLVVNVHLISSVYREMAVCRHCQSGDLHLFNKGTKAGCATLLLLSCLHCHVSKSFWSVSGRFGSSIDVGSGKSIPKRNSTVYASVLAGRLIGVGCERLSLYHASLGIPSCPAASTFSDVECDILTAAESIANKCMDKASVDLERILGLNQSTGLVRAVGSFDGAYQQRSGRAGGGFSRYCFASSFRVKPQRFWPMK